jgi:hypothetical protein
MTGFLNDLKLESVESDPNYIADGQYPGYIFDSKIVTKKKDQTQQWVITYKIAPEANRHAGQTQDEFYNVGAAPGRPETGPSEANKSWLKKRVLGLGVPENSLAALDPKDVIGTPVTITIVHRNGYQNIGDAVVRSENAGPSSTGPVAPTGQPASNGDPFAGATNAPVANTSDVAAGM